MKLASRLGAVFFRGNIFTELLCATVEGAI
jgi:hypothetical protein